MIILFVLLVCLLLYRVRMGDFHEDYMSLSAKNAVKGFLTLVILFSSMIAYWSL